jgi:hypothetical protein
MPACPRRQIPGILDRRESNPRRAFPGRTPHLVGHGRARCEAPFAVDQSMRHRTERKNTSSPFAIENGASDSPLGPRAENGGLLSLTRLRIRRMSGNQRKTKMPSPWKVSQIRDIPRKVCRTRRTCAERCRYAFDRESAWFNSRKNC